MGELFQRLMAEAPERREAMMNIFLQKKARKLKAPISLQIELTPLCTLKCKMCYVVENNSDENIRILDGEKWISLISQAVDMGVLNLTISGGECFMHPDFACIYAAAYDMGCNVTLISNGTLFSEEIFEFLRNRPPKRICITMYGFSSKTYEQACGNGTVFEKLKNTVISLKEAGFPIVLQSTITVDSFHDIPDIARFAKSIDVPYFYTDTLKANRKCELTKVLELSISEEQSKWIDEKVFEYTGNQKKEAPLCEMIDFGDESQNGTDCGAGNSLFHINWRGELTPCVTFEPVVAYPLECGVQKAWEIVRDYCASIPKMMECRQCCFFNRCHHCVALHWGDTEEFGYPSSRLCWKKTHSDRASKEEAEYLAMKGNGERSL